MKHPSEALLKNQEKAPNVYQLLQGIERTGWKDRGVKDPETVKEHTEALLALANELLPQLSTEEKYGLMEMLEVHDWPEAIHGDEVVLVTDEDDKKAMLEAKFANEKTALETLCKDLSNREDIMSLWLRFETSSDPAASFARQLDKYQAVEKALEYEKAQGIALFEEFLTYSIRFIDHSLLLKRIEELKTIWKEQKMADN